MSEWKPGTVAIVTARGIEGVLAFRRSSKTDRHTQLDWAHSPDAERGLYYSCTNDDQVTDVRPLVVLDAPQVDLNVAADRLRNAGFSELARQIEAQTKPPRICEPGLWATVEASIGVSVTRYRWGRVDSDEEPSWYCGEAGWANWSDLTDPVLIREGVES